MKQSSRTIAVALVVVLVLLIAGLVAFRFFAIRNMGSASIVPEGLHDSDEPDDYDLYVVPPKVWPPKQKVAKEFLSESAKPVISEFMADNRTAYEYSTRTYEDWIEICNPSTKKINLKGYYLTDDKEELTKWKLPESEIEPGDFRERYAGSDPVFGFQPKPTGESDVQPIGATERDQMACGENLRRWLSWLELRQMRYESSRISVSKRNIGHGLMMFLCSFLIGSVTSGMGVEKLKYQTLDRYLTASAMLLVVAWRVEQIKVAARVDGDASCEDYFESSECRETAAQGSRDCADDDRVHRIIGDARRLHK